MPVVVAATDGSAINNPHGPAGWAWFVSEDCWAAGGFTKASNQVAELFAVLALLRAVPRDFDLLVRTDSEFTINVLTKWLPGWKSNGWRKRDGEQVANLALIQDLDRAIARRVVRLEKVKGHSGDPMNEIADRICGDASRKIARDEPVVTGPGWTGYNPDPVVPALGRRRGEKFPASPKPAAKSAGPSRVVGERINETDLRAQGWGANARVVRVDANALKRPEATPKMEICGSCDGPIHPLTLHCRCGSM